MTQTTSTCERCWQDTDLSTLEYGGTAIRVCLVCHKLICGVLLGYARDIRVAQLQHFKRQWKEQRERKQGRG